MEAATAEFMAITGATKKLAVSYLDAAAGAVDVAVELFFGDETEPKNKSGNSSTAAATASMPSMPSSNRKRKRSTDRNDSESGEIDREEKVRPPIPPKRETLVEESAVPSRKVATRFRRGGNRSVFEGLRDFREETRAQETGVRRGKRKTLEDIFRPPVDITYRGTFEQVKKFAQSCGKWLLANIQDTTEFACQILNRDVWSNQSVRDILAANFVLWQVHKDSNEGETFCQFYPFEQYPHVAFLDPRTGERLVQLENVTAESIQASMNEFLCNQGELPSSNPKSKSASKRFKAETIIDESEEAQLNAAIARSLAETKKGKAGRKKVKRIVIEDSDSDAFVSVSSEGTEASGKGSGKDSGSETVAVSSQETQLVTDCSHLEINDGKKKAGSDQDIVQKDDLDKWRVEESELGATKVLLRLPDGARETLVLSKEAPLLVLWRLVECRGFPLGKYEIVTHFPRKNLCQVDSSLTLREAGLWPSETAFVQEIQ